MKSNITTSSSFLHDGEGIPGPSQQTENTQQEALQAWLIKTHNRLRFLSQIEHSISFANLISSLDKELQPEASEKNSIELLLALDDFAAKEKDSSLSIQFFIQKILKNCRSLIKENRDTYAKLTLLEETINQSSLTEDPKQLQIKLLDLNKEQKQLQKSLDLDVELTRLIELTHDLEKFKLENNRDFMHEIAMHETKLKAHTQELDKIIEKAAKIEEELTFSFDQLEANLRIKQRKLLHMEVDLYTLKQIHLDDIIKKLFAQLELEITRLSLISELKEYAPIKILKTQIENPNTKQEDLRTESKIKKDLIQNAKNLNDITEFFKDIIQLVPIKNNNIIKSFLEKIQSTLNLNIDKNALEAKQAKTNDESTTLQAELVAFLQQNESELIKHLEELAKEKQKEIEKLKIKKQNLEILLKKHKLINQISKLEEKIQTTKNDQHIFSMLEDKNLPQLLIYIEKLQKFADNTCQNIRTLEKEHCKKDVAKLNSELHKEKIIILEKKYILDLNAQYEAQDTALQVENDYRNQIEKEINIIRDIKTKEWQSKLAQNQRALRFNAIDIRRLSAKIEKQKSNLSHEIQRKLLIEQIVKLSKENNTQQEHIFFDSLQTQLIDLKKQAENIAWDKSGWGFFFKKVPDGIQKIRGIFNAKTFGTSEPETNVESNNLTMLNIFSEIYSLIKQKNSSTSCLRSSSVKNFYQSLQKSLTQVNNQFLTLSEPDVEMHDTAQPTCSTFPY